MLKDSTSRIVKTCTPQLLHMCRYVGLDLAQPRAAAGTSQARRAAGYGYAMARPCCQPHYRRRLPSDIKTRIPTGYVHKCHVSVCMMHVCAARPRPTTMPMTSTSTRRLTRRTLTSTSARSCYDIVRFYCLYCIHTFNGKTEALCVSFTVPCQAFQLTLPPLSTCRAGYSY